MTRPDAELLYTALVSDGKRLGSLRRLQYRCAAEGCLLLDAVDVGGAILLHQKRYKNSPDVNERRSNSAGRARNTFDGATHWKPRTYWIESSALAYPDDQPQMRLSVQCDHVGVRPGGGDDVTLSARGFHDDWNARHAEVRLRADGSYFAVV